MSVTVCLSVCLSVRASVFAFVCVNVCVCEAYKEKEGGVVREEREVWRLRGGAAFESEDVEANRRGAGWGVGGWWSVTRRAPRGRLERNFGFSS